MISDNEEDDGNLHQDVICEDGEWGGIMDVIALTDILKVNIIIMIMRKEGYTVQPFVQNKKSKTIFVKYNGKNHFEPLLAKFDLKTPSVSASKSKSKSLNKSKSKSKSPILEENIIVETIGVSTSSRRSSRKTTARGIKHKKHRKTHTRRKK